MRASTPFFHAASVDGRDKPAMTENTHPNRAKMRPGLWRGEGASARAAVRMHRAPRYARRRKRGPV